MEHVFHFVGLGVIIFSVFDVDNYQLSILKKEIKEKLNIKRITFYISNVLNAHISK
jgi:hypothetical protein